MNDPVLERLAALGLVLPPAPQPLGAYKAVVQSGALLFLSGQLPIREGAVVYRGAVGAALTADEGRAAAQLCALNALAQIHRFLGGFDRLRQIVRVDGYVASAPGNFEQPKVLDGASDLFASVLGERAGHARTAFAVPQLPADATVELAVIVEVAA
jgi:enamine deaminase RidA (YjgF/YER057c/UK114 family)